MPSTINERISDFLLRNSHYLHRVENGTVRDIAQHYHGIKPELERLLRDTEKYATGFTRDYRIARLNDTLNEVNIVMDIAAKDATGTLEESLRDIGSAQADALYEKLSRELGPIGLTLGRLPTADVFAIAEQKMLGEVFGDRFLWNNAWAVKEMRSSLANSIILGEDMAQATGRIIGVGAKLQGTTGRKIIERAAIIVRTEIQRVSNSVNEAVYDRNSDVIKGVQAIATLDNRTCITCASLDGNEYYYGL